MALFLLFRVSSRLCALSLSHVVETMRPLEVRPVRSNLAPVSGIAVVRGAPLPVLNAADLFAADGSRPTRFIVARNGARQYVLAVDSVEGIRDIAGEALRELPALLEDVDAEIVEAIGVVDAELLTLLKNDTRIVPEAAWAEIDSAKRK